MSAGGTVHMPACFLLLVALLLAGGGFVLLRRARRPLRYGQTPHCRNCDYNLTGLTGEKCPECGGQLTAGNIVYGEAHGSRRPLIVGVVCLVPLAAMLWLAIPQVHWYSYRPTGWLITDVQASNPATFNRAWNELDRRDKAGSLSPSQRSRLIDQCLQEQAAPAVTYRTADMVNYLGRKCLGDELSPAQKETFIKQILIVSMRTRPRAVAGDQVSFEVPEQSRAPAGSFWVAMKISDIAVDGKVVRKAWGGRSSFSGAGGGGCTGGSVPIKTPGRHTISLTVTASVHAGQYGDEDKARLVGKAVYPLKSEVEVLATQPADYIRPIRNPALADELYLCVKPEEFRLTGDTDLRLEGKLAVRNSPAPIAFEILMRIDGREYSISSTSEPAGGGTNLHLSHDWRKGSEDAPAPFSSCDVILRSSEKVARHTVDLFEYWEGELVYKNVPVTLEGAATQPTRPAKQ